MARGGFYGGSTPVDSSNWPGSSASSTRDGEPVPAPGPMEQTKNGLVRSVTPDPYAAGSGAPVNRSFGRNDD